MRSTQCAGHYEKPFTTQFPRFATVLSGRLPRATLVPALPRCVSQKGRVRSLGYSSLGINLAAALLVVCTLL